MVQIDDSKSNKLIMKRHQAGVAVLYALTAPWLDNEVPSTKIVRNIKGSKLQCFAKAQPSIKTEQWNPVLPLLLALASASPRTRNQRFLKGSK